MGDSYSSAATKDCCLVAWELHKMEVGASPYRAQLARGFYRAIIYCAKS